MEIRNTITVLIMGQEYTISSDLPRDYIMKLASKVDESMKSISYGKNQSLSQTAVLSALTIADEYFQARDLGDRNLKQCNELKKEYRELERQLDEEKKRSALYISAGKGERSDEDEAKISELECRCKDMESNIFDLQMENIRLKNELEEYKQQDF